MGIIEKHERFVRITKEIDDSITIKAKELQEFESNVSISGHKHDIFLELLLMFEKEHRKDFDQLMETLISLGKG